ncbi:MAG: acetoacetyl-CoA reductase [Candidatus Pacebacteria bacterium]|nr:acetoacetyl-CoA reductase [Candidatus Paceibacterota bacterium]
MTRIALVTGGTRGIGAAIAERLQKSGCKVVATFASNQAAAADYRARTGIEVRQWNAGDFTACMNGVKEVEASIGPIDILVNNAGITRDVPLHKMTESQWDEVLTADLKSCFAMSRAVIEGMRSRSFGRIINISSINGQRGQFGQSNYCAAKSGMIGFTKALALESAIKKITVNAVAPGYIDTEMVAAVAPEILAKITAQIPLGRLGHAEEIASAVNYLASEEAGFITGMTLSINGGHYMAG